MSRVFRIIIVGILTISATNSYGSITENTLSEKAAAKPFVVETVGQGKPVLFLPGFTTPGSIWKETVENLTLKRKSYLFSYAGFNGNEAIEMPWYSTIKNAIVEYVKNEDMSDIIIIGHSMGGNLAVDIAAELPDRVSKIVLVDALPCMRDVMMPGVPGESLFYESPYNKQMLNMGEEEFKNMASMMASNMTYNTSKEDLLAKWIIEADRETYVYGYTDLLKLDLREVLSKVRSEALIIGASFPDAEVAKMNFEKQYAKLANKTITMSSESRHFVMLDQPEWFYETVNDFLVNEEN